MSGSTSRGPIVPGVLRPVLGLVAGAVTVALVAFAPWLPWPTLTFAPASVAIAPESAVSTEVCTGDLLIAGRDAASAGVSVAASQAVVRAAPGGDPGVPGVLSSEASGSMPTVWSTSGDAPAAAAGSATVGDPDLAGFAASACRVGLLDSWIVGGAGTTGSADLLLLSNPGEVAATVTLTVYGATGPEVPPGGAGVVVAPGTQQVVPLAGLALGEESPVVHVQAEGAPVTAALQASITRTLEPGGVDQLGALEELATTAVFPGVAVVQAEAGATSGGASTLVRLLAPDSDGTAVITVRTVGASAATIEPTTVALSAGVPSAVGMPDLPAGDYVIEVVADVPIASGLWQTTGFGAGSDFAWYPPAPVIDAGAGAVIAVPDGPSPTLTLVNPAQEEATIQVTPGGGASATAVVLPAGASAQVPLRAATAYTLSGDAVRASVRYAATGALAAFAVWPQDAGAEPIVIYP